MALDFMTFNLMNSQLVSNVQPPSIGVADSLEVLPAFPLAFGPETPAWIHWANEATRSGRSNRPHPTKDTLKK